jgi:two-component sensor histidine kinase
MSPEQFKPDQFKKDLQRVLSLIRTSQRYLEDGKVVELSALESRVADLCTQAQAMSPAHREEVAPLLAALTEELGAFEADMQKEYIDIQRQLRGISNTTQATNAYAQAARTK